MKIFYIILMLLLTYTSAFAAMKMAEPVSNPVVIKHNDVIYLIGGNNSDGAVKSVRAYSNGIWKKLPYMNESRYGHCGCYYNGRIYVFGGIKNYNKEETILASVESMDINTHKWRKEKSLPEGRARFAMALSGDRLYIFGGVNSKGTINTVLEYDFSRPEFIYKAHMPSAVNRACGVISHNGKILVIGGEDVYGKTLDSVIEYNQLENTFTYFKPIKTPRKNFAALSVNNYIVITGGWNEIEGKKVFLNSTEVFDPFSLEWTEGPSLKIGRDGARSVNIGNKLLVFGGYNGKLLSSVEEINMDFIPSGWVIDKNLKFHLACLWEDNFIQPDNPLETPPSCGYTKDYMPDISNINLASIKKLGFPLPDIKNPDKYNLYLKLFQFPESYDVMVSLLPILSNYSLTSLKNANILEDFAFKKENVLVKLGYIGKSDEKFSQENPFPSFKVRNNSQPFFNSHIPFVSLYVNPSDKKEQFTSEDDKAFFSARGVMAFHRELIDSYRDNLIEISGPESEQYFYFIKENKFSSGMVLLKVQRNPFIFKNWRDLPMPQDPSNIFLSGLLLVYRTEYIRINKKDGKIFPDMEDLKNFQKINDTVLEIGSVKRR